MALVNNSVLGEISGKIGNIVLRQVYGKTVAYERPPHYKAAKTPAARKTRNSFGSAVKLAKVLIADTKLNETWASAKIQGVNSNQRIIKQNIKLFDGRLLTTRNKITPEGLFLKVDSASFQNQTLHLTLNCPAENNLKFPADLFILYYFEKADKSMLLTRTTVSQGISGGIYELDINPGKYIGRLLKEEPQALLLIALVSESVSKKKPYWTTTEAVRLS